MTTTTMAPARSSYSYEACLAASERIQWRVEDLIGGERQLDFTKPFLPEALARVEPLGFLSPMEKLALNQIRAHTYLTMFGLVEEFILPFVLDHARPQLAGDDVRVRALLQFAGEEAKHIHLFKRFREEFAKGFGSPCAVIGPPEDIAKHVLGHEALPVALLILHIEWMTQAHYLEGVKDASGLDAQFKSLLKHHWMEEAQHAKMDTLMVEALAEGRSEEQIVEAVDAYLGLGLFFDAGLEQQVQLDMDSLERAIRRKLTPAEADEFVRVQRQANRWTYLGSGLSHPNVLATIARLSPAAARRVREVAPTFC